MISKEAFLEIFIAIDRFVKESNIFLENKILNSDYILDYSGLGWTAVETSLKCLFLKEGIDWIYWWFFDKPYVKGNIKARNSLGEIIPTETPEDLWNIIEEYRL